MRLLMISGDRSLLQGKKGAFWHTLDGLRTHFDRIDIITPRVPNAPRTASPFPNVFVHASPRGLWYQPLWIIRKGKELFRTQRHDVMTVHDYPPFYNGIGARWLVRSCRLPYALEAHHIVGFPVASSFVEAMGRLLSRIVLREGGKRAKAVRVVNHHVRSTLTAWGVPAEKVRLVPSFYLELDGLKPQPHAPKKYDVVFCGRLTANKGLVPLIRALKPLDASLLVIGDGPVRRKGEALVRRFGMQARVTFMGWLPTQQDVMAAMQSAKIFVMNSRSEGGPRVALEAMACGMPVIATRVGVMPDVIEHGKNGLLVSMKGKDLTAAVQRLLADEGLRKRFSQEAPKAVAHFERGPALRAYADFLKSLA